MVAGRELSLRTQLEMRSYLRPERSGPARSFHSSCGIAVRRSLRRPCVQQREIRYSGGRCFAGGRGGAGPLDPTT